MTVHKAQGSEYDTVLLPLVCEQKAMLNVNLVYTALSRAKKRIILVGSESVLEYSLTVFPDRNSTLIQRIKAEQRRLAC